MYARRCANTSQPARTLLRPYCVVAAGKQILVLRYALATRWRPLIWPVSGPGDRSGGDCANTWQSTRRDVRVTIAGFFGFAEGLF